MEENFIEDFIFNKRKRQDNSKENEYYKLISDIDDLDGVMSEYLTYANEENNYLQYALIYDKEEYYFFDVRKNPTTLRSKTDGREFICPYCKQNLFPRTGWINKSGVEVPSHLVHYDNADKDCIFRTFTTFEKKKYKSKIAESILHFRIKLAFYKLAKLGQMKIKYLSDFKIIEDIENLTVESIGTYKEVNIIDAIMEKKVLDKNEETKGYRPDLIFITEDNEIIYGEVTCKSSKPIREYEDRWKRAGKIVVEIKPIYGKDNRVIDLKEDEVLKINNDAILIKKDYNLNKIILPDVEKNILYSPEDDYNEKLLHEIRIKHSNIRELRKIEALKREQERIAELNRQLEIEKVKKPIEKEIWHLACSEAKKFNVIFDWNLKKWINKENQTPVNSSYKRIVFDDFELKRTFPNSVWINLKRKGYKIEG